MLNWILTENRTINKDFCETFVGKCQLTIKVLSVVRKRKRQISIKILLL